MKMTNLILGVVVAATVVAGFLLASRYNPSFFPSLTPSQAPASIKETAEVKISLVPQTTSLQVGQESLYNVVVDPKDKLVIGLDVAFFFDPTLVSVSSIVPTEYFQTSDVIDNNIDTNTGKITYAVGAGSNPAGGSGAVFQIKFTPLQATSGLSSLISFDKDNTKIPVQGTSTKVIGEAQTVVLFDEQPITVLP